MVYAFILGRVYSLSLAELLSVFDQLLKNTGQSMKILECSEEVIVIEATQSLDVVKLQKQLGGIIKILQVVDVLKKREQDSLNFALKHYFKPSSLKKDFFKDYKGKKQFGLSIYLLDMDLLQPPPSNRQGLKIKDERFLNIFGEPKRLGMMVKKTLTESGLSVRLVLPEYNSLSLASVAVTKNLLLEKGAEICILASKDRVYTAKTLTVQDFEDYGRRDYQRPVRDEKQGMIPPKVAQIMLNLSGCEPGQTILDPFCGIGTIIQEGLLLGFKMLGSDINKQAILGSEKNLEWFRNRYKIAPGKYHFEVADATNFAPLVKSQNISAIVTEGTLGPIYSEYPSQKDIEQNFADLQNLYLKAFEEFKKTLPDGGKIVICFPAYKKGQNYQSFPSLDFLLELGYNFKALIPESLMKQLKFLKLTSRQTVIYDRKDQIVAREIAIFEKN